MDFVLALCVFIVLWLLTGSLLLALLVALLLAVVFGGRRYYIR